MPCLAISIIPLLRAAPMNTPTAATAKTNLKGAAFAPTAELRKFTASLLTPTKRSMIAKSPKKTRIIVNKISIQEFFVCFF